MINGITVEEYPELYILALQCSCKILWTGNTVRVYPCPFKTLVFPLFDIGMKQPHSLALKC